MSTAELFELRAWDSDFFGVRIGRLHATRLTPALVAQTVEWCRAQRVQCLYFLAEFDDPRTVGLAEQHGFRLVDVRVLLARACSEAVAAPVLPLGVVLRTARADDVPALRAVAKVGHRDTRFYFDGRFAAEKCDELYEIWIEKSCHGFADCVFVAEVSGRVGGYLACKQAEPGVGEIGLVGVAEFAQGRGLGPALVQTAVHWAAAQGLPQMRVVTQGRNRAAQRMYQRCGFLTDEVRLWYHRWFE